MIDLLLPQLLTKLAIDAEKYTVIFAFACRSKLQYYYMPIPHMRGKPCQIVYNNSMARPMILTIELN
jgi:hypothetical protein